MKQEGRNDGMFIRMFKNAYESACESLYQEWNDLAKKSDIKNDQQVKVEIEALVYFLFDFSFSLGPETDIRNALRGFLVEGIEGTNTIKELYSRRAIEYISELQKTVPEKNKLLNFGNVFAEHTNNGADILVVTWVIEQMGSIMDLAKKIMDRIINGLPKNN